MKKLLYYFTLLMCCSSYVFAVDSLGIITDKDLESVGVSKENIKNAKLMVDRVSVSYNMLLLERRQLELQVNQYVLDGPEQNLSKIDEIFDKIGQIEAKILKDRVRSQIQMKKYITQDQYIRARELAERRLSLEGK